MKTRFQVRRDLLKLATLSSAAVALTSMVPLRRKDAGVSSRPLRVAVNDWLPDELLKDIDAHYLSPVRELTGRSCEIVRVSNEGFLRKGRSEDFDLFLTSPSFHSWLNQDHLFFGPLPFGMKRDEKSRWLFSHEGLAYQRKYFSSLGLVPQPVAVGSDEVGCFASKPLDDWSGLRGASIASPDVRGEWFARRGLRPLSAEPIRQIELMKAGRLDISDFYPAGTSVYLADRLDGGNLTYWLAPGLKTAPVVHALWSKAAWYGLKGGARESLLERARSAFGEVSARWAEREREHFRRISSRFPVKTLSEDLLRALNEDALRLRSVLAGRNGFSRRLARAYFRHADLPGRAIV